MFKSTITPEPESKSSDNTLLELDDTTMILSDHSEDKELFSVAYSKENTSNHSVSDLDDLVVVPIAFSERKTTFWYLFCCKMSGLNIQCGCWFVVVGFLIWFGMTVSYNPSSSHIRTGTSYVPTFIPSQQPTVSPSFESLTQQPPFSGKLGSFLS